eukprot:13569909-Alexandrium_andersonii.AAC.1
MDKYAGSGYDASQEIIDRWSIRLADEPEFEDAFQEWCRGQDALLEKAEGCGASGTGANH